MSTGKREPVPELRVTPIGVLRTPFTDRASAPRQPAAARDVRGTIELVPDGRFEHALADLDAFRHIWVLFWFHLNDGWKAKVRPPRSAQRRGVFATRAPHRPNPIGMSVLRLDRIEGTCLHVLDVDMVDGSPVVDIKPYLPYADSIPEAGHGWLDAGERGGAEPRAAPDPGPAYEVQISARAESQLAFLREAFDVELRSRIVEALSLGPAPHPYRRIRKDGDGFRLAVREWRVWFRLEGTVVSVERLLTGYRASELRSSDPSLAAHREYVERYGADGERDLTDSRTDSPRRPA